MSENIRIIALEVENVKRLKAVRINPGKTVVKIEGRNAQGKSSLLDAIAATLGGGKWNPDMPIRQGETHAGARLDLGDLIVERKWKDNGRSYLSVTNAQGFAAKSPQAILDKLVGDLMFDPLEFVRMKPAEQAIVLKRIAGIDCTTSDNERCDLYARRTVESRGAKQNEAAIGAKPTRPDSNGVDISKLIAKQDEVSESNRTRERLVLALDAKREEANRKAAEWTKGIGAMRTLVDAAREELTRANATIDKLTEDIEETKREADASKLEMSAQIANAVGAVDAVPLVPAIDLAAEIAEGQRINEALKRSDQWDAGHEVVKAHRRLVNDLTAKIDEIDNAKRLTLANASYPLPGLGVGEHGPTMNGIPLTQASSAEQLRIGVAVGLADAHDARIILIRDGSLLDDDGMAALQDICEEFDAQCFIERVAAADTGSPGAVFIEDGEVVTASVTETKGD